MPTAELGLRDWSLEPTVTAGLVLLTAVYVAMWRRGLLRRDDDTSPWFAAAWLRPWLFGLGILSGFIALESPIDTGGDEYLLTLHMVQHLVLMMVSPPLVLLGVAGMRPPPPGRATRARAAWTWITRPWPALVLFNAVMLFWHIPALYDATLTDEPLHVVEHLTFIAVGLVFWWPIVDPLRGPGTRPIGPFQKIAMLSLGGVPPTVLGFVFVMAHTAYYGFYVAAPRLWGLTPLNDQQFAGVIMLGVGNVIYFLAISVIFLRLFGAPGEDEEELEAEARAGHAAG